MPAFLRFGRRAAVREAGIATFAAADSNAFAAERGMTPAETALTFGDDNLSAELPGVVVFDPGPGHTEDNIVVGLPNEGIVFGGCLVRPPGTDNLGNTADADIAHWDDAVQAVADQFPAAQVVVPSHGPPAGRELLDLTISLARAARPG